MSTLKTNDELNAFLAEERGVLFIDVTWSEAAAKSRDAVVAFHRAWKDGPHADAGVVFARVDASEGSGEVYDRCKVWFNGAGYPGPELMSNGRGVVAWSRGGGLASLVLCGWKASAEEMVGRTVDAFGLE